LSYHSLARLHSPILNGSYKQILYPFILGELSVAHIIIYPLPVVSLLLLLSVVCFMWQRGLSSPYYSSARKGNAAYSHRLSCRRQQPVSRNRTENSSTHNRLPGNWLFAKPTFYLLWSQKYITTIDGNQCPHCKSTPITENLYGTKFCLIKCNEAGAEWYIEQLFRLKLRSYPVFARERMVAGSWFGKSQSQHTQCLHRRGGWNGTGRFCFCPSLT